MKAQSMKAPVISELYNQKLIHEAHRKKLQNIRSQRKTQLGIDKNRNQMMNSLRENKSKTFANNFNREYQSINSNNLKVVKKLESVKPSPIIASNRSRTKSEESFSVIDNESVRNIRNSRLQSQYQKRKREQNQKENYRLVSKLKSVSSSLNPSKLQEEHHKRQEMKKRLMRYSKNSIGRNTAVQLKSEKFISQHSNAKSTYLANLNEKNRGHSTANHKNRSERQYSTTSHSQKPNQSSLGSKNKHDLKSKRPSNTAQFYRKDNIRNNTIQEIGKRVMGSNRRSNKYQLEDIVKSAKNTIENQEDAEFYPQSSQRVLAADDGFFATQIIRSKRALNSFSSQNPNPPKQAQPRSTGQGGVRKGEQKVFNKLSRAPNTKI